MSQSEYLIDTSAYVRLMRDDDLTVQWAAKSEAGQLGVCAVTELEILYTARSSEHRRVLVTDLREAYRWVVMADRVFERAKTVQHELGSQGRLRAAGPVDLLVAATAEEHGMTVLHYDSGFQCVSEITGQRVQWLAEPGSIS
ncbi:PIN domain nuclease [Paractinoplanes maris]|uniref:PIN domain nuclease n=1 Tax=Paractinoplanes maris TaxID=1734446 RepID=UPI002022695D|nr:PIN domain nuclease [Actinoplanes maris]